MGKGNSSTVLPATQEEMEKHELSQGRERPDFKIVQCDKEGSLLFQFDKIARDVSDKVSRRILEYPVPTNENLHTVYS